jgi:hypothetical protein
LGRNLIWVFSNEQGWEHSGLYCVGQVCGPRGEVIDIAPATKVRLWHPLASEASEVQKWREHIFTSGVRQPFRQAFREFYEVTDDERQTKMYSNRFAGILMRQHQFSSLCRARGWKYRLMGAEFDGFNVPTKILAPWNMHAEFYVDLPSDRKPSLYDSALGERSASASISSSVLTNCGSIVIERRSQLKMFPRSSIQKSYVMSISSLASVPSDTTSRGPTKAIGEQASSPREWILTSSLPYSRSELKCCPAFCPSRQSPRIAKSKKHGS